MQARLLVVVKFIEVMVAGFLRPEVFLDWSRNFVAFAGDGLKMTKIGAKYHHGATRRCTVVRKRSMCSWMKK